ncbi:BQ2448_3298 [Microbotryum intermedium]|uniref:Proteasome assembly chaperone 2 n=1 Tax=Microbotryum intermedium TaxID=269621 RepID=A0A238FCZ5_9BASI|nr:BQ2448_3298 [Microbotryum intermedium]
MVLPDLEKQFFVPSTNGGKPSFRGSSLILPQPSLGSLPQLALDLYVHTFRLELVGYAALRDTVPCVAGIDVVEGEESRSGDGGFSWATQVYQTRPTNTQGESITLVLPRAPIIQARKRHYLDALTAWIRQSEFRDVLIVGAVDAAMRRDEALRETNPFRSLVLPVREGTHLSPLLQRLGKSVRSYLEGTAPSTSSKPIPSIPHGGLSRSLLQHLSDSNPVSEPITSQDGPLPPVGALLVYTAEGENEGLARRLGEVVSSLITGSEEGKEGTGNGNGVQWKVPKSWRLGLMGDELGRERRGEMYG